MGYERNDRRYGRDQGYPRTTSQDRDYDRGYGRDRYDQVRSCYGADRAGSDDPERQNDRSGGYDRGGRDYGRQPQGYDYEDRGFVQRAGDEVRSWFGDEEAERRRQLDERYRERDEREQDRDARGRYGSIYGAAPSGYGAGAYGGAFGQGSGDYRADRGTGSYGTADRGRGDWGHDTNYRQWRDRQVEALDRDYDEYRREHQSKFEQEFHGWRTTRQGQRDTLGKVREHQEVIGSDGQHVGTVDKVRGDRIILTKNDQDAHNHHHSIPSAWIKEVADKVTIAKTADEAQSHWRDEERSSAIGGGRRDEERIGKDHNLNRSFSGTY